MTNEILHRKKKNLWCNFKSFFFDFLGLDFQIKNILILRLWSVFSGAVLLIIIPYTLSEAQQGYYFTFSSLIALQLFFELGFNTVIVQFVGHESVGVNFTSDSKVAGVSRNLQRLYQLILLVTKWYIVSGLLFFIIVLSSGWLYFCIFGSSSVNSIEWMITWPLLVLCASLNLFLSPFLAIIEGLGDVGQVAKLRLAQSVIGYTVLVIALLAGFSLYAVPIILGSSALVTSYWLFKNYKAKYQSLFKIVSCNKYENNNTKLNWRYDIFPFQWRIALSWASGYLIFQLFTPVFFVTQGAKIAGKVGLTLTIFATIVSVSMSWVNAKVPQMAQLIALNNRIALNKLFRFCVSRSAICNIILCCLFVFWTKYFYFIFPAITKRVINNDSLILLCVISIFNHLIFSMAIYMRAHKKEPMLLPSLFTAVAVGLSVFFGSHYSVFITMCLYAFIVLAVCFPWTFFIFLKYYRIN